MERISCPLSGWAVRVGEGQSLVLKTSIQWDFNSAPFEILRRVALLRAQYDESCKLCSGGSYCLSLASMVESVGEAWEAVVYPVADVSGSSPLISSP